MNRVSYKSILQKNERDKNDAMDIILRRVKKKPLFTKKRFDKYIKKEFKNQDQYTSQKELVRLEMLNNLDGYELSEKNRIKKMETINPLNDRIRKLGLLGQTFAPGNIGIPSVPSRDLKYDYARYQPIIDIATENNSKGYVGNTICVIDMKDNLYALTDKSAITRLDNDKFFGLKRDIDVYLRSIYASRSLIFLYVPSPDTLTGKIGQLASRRPLSILLDFISAKNNISQPGLGNDDTENSMKGALFTGMHTEENMAERKLREQVGKNPIISFGKTEVSDKYEDLSDSASGISGRLTVEPSNEETSKKVDDAKLILLGRLDELEIGVDKIKKDIKDMENTIDEGEKILETFEKLEEKKDELDDKSNISQKRYDDLINSDEYKTSIAAIVQKRVRIGRRNYFIIDTGPKQLKFQNEALYKVELLTEKERYEKKEIKLKKEADLDTKDFNDINDKYNAYIKKHDKIQIHNSLKQSSDGIKKKYDEMSELIQKNHIKLGNNIIARKNLSADEITKFIEQSKEIIENQYKKIISKI